MQTLYLGSVSQLSYVSEHQLNTAVQTLSNSSIILINLERNGKQLCTGCLSWNLTKQMKNHLLKLSKTRRKRNLILFKLPC